MTLERFDIVIVGAGLVGASLAAALSHSALANKLRIVVVDGGKPSIPPKDEKFDPRVVALTRQSQALFAELGIWEQIEYPKNGGHRACPYTHMHVWDGEGTGQIDFDCHDIHQTNLGYIVENSLLTHQLETFLAGKGNVEVYWQEKLIALETGDENRIHLSSGRVLSAPLVLAADGANSQVRKLAQFQTREWHYGHQAIVATVKTELAHGFTAWQRFMASGPLAFLPLLTPGGDDHHSSIVWSLEEELAAEIVELDDEAFKQKLAQQFEAKLGAITWVDRRFCFPLIQRHAKTYCQPGIALLGDAAHTIHPLAGQGVNLGLLDVQAMVAEIERALDRGIPLDDYSILRRYQRQRMGPNLAMMGLMEGFKQLFGSSNAWVTVLRNSGMGIVGSLPLVRNGLTKRAMGL